MSWDFVTSARQSGIPRGEFATDPETIPGSGQSQAPMSRRLVIGTLAGALAAASLDSASATREAERRKDRKKDGPGNHPGPGHDRSGATGEEESAAPADAEGRYSAATPRKGASTKASTASFTANLPAELPVWRIDTWAQIGTIRIKRIRREDKVDRYLDTLQIDIYDILADRLNPGTDIWVRPMDGMIWNGKKTFINRGAARTWATFTYQVTIGKVQGYEIWLMPFIEDVRTGTTTWISQNDSWFIPVW
ncbi:MAG: hypothetical protein ACKOWF_16885 [Chloroflexota bacterium]